MTTTHQARAEELKSKLAAQRVKLFNEAHPIGSRLMHIPRPGAKPGWARTTSEAFEMAGRSMVYVAHRLDPVETDALYPAPPALNNPGQDYLTARGRTLDGGAKILVFNRDGLFFALNFHWTQSYPDWEIVVPPGDYDLALNTDAPAFGGQGRIADGQTYIALPKIRGDEQVHAIRVYLPARTAVVLVRRRPAT